MNSAKYQSSTDRVNSRLDGSTLTIEFNNPTRHNALSVDMWEAVPALLSEAQEDSNIRLVVFQGAGSKAFVSGADISQFEDMRAAKEAVTRYEAMAETALMSIYNFAKPTLACIQGYCIGGGVNVAISCDLRIACDDAVFSVPAARLGLGYRYSAMKNLVDLIGPGAAKDLFFTARRIDGIEAHRIGLVSRICPSDQLGKLLTEYTQALAQNAPLTIQAAKYITGEVLKASPQADLSKCQQLIRGCFESADYAEGRKAFMEKRQPIFRGL
jgi:enoyl-CoA hydratase